MFLCFSGTRLSNGIAVPLEWLSVPVVCKRSSLLTVLSPEGRLQPVLVAVYIAPEASTGVMPMNWASVSDRPARFQPCTPEECFFFPKLSQRIGPRHIEITHCCCVYATQRGACTPPPAPWHLKLHHRHAKTTG